MSRSLEQRIEDILLAVEKCYDYQQFLSQKDTEEMAMDAILRNLAVIGEAVNHLPDSFSQDYPEVEWKAIIGMRNILIHQYFKIDSQDIIDVLESDLSQLKETLLKIKEN